MKKVLLFFLLLTSLSYSSQETLSIDDALNRVENDKGSYEFKKFQNSQEGTNIRIKDNKLGDFNGVTLSSGYNISENNFDNRPRKYDRTFQNKATYGPFFVNYNYVQSDRSYVSFGIEKNLKDVFYSKYNSNLKINNLQLELNQINYDKNMQAKKINLISLYQDILNTKNELEYRKKAYEHYRIDLNKLKKSYELGASPKINLESAELEAEDSKLQIDILETKLKSLYDVGKTDYNIDFENYKLLDFIENKESIDSLLNNYMEKEIIELRLNLSVAEEKKSYSNYDRYMPNLYLGYERVDRNLRGDRYYRDQDL
ncbi:TolC family protein, partial [Fusobacterium simiae]